MSRLSLVQTVRSAKLDMIGNRANSQAMADFRSKSAIRHLLRIGPLELWRSQDLRNLAVVTGRLARRYQNRHV